MEKALRIIGVLAYLALAFRLWRAGLLKSYRWLFIYSLFAAVRIFQSLLFTAFNTDLYFYWWATTEVLAWVLFVLMILELHGLIFQHYPGLASFGRKLFQIGLGVSIPISLLTLLPRDWARPDRFSNLCRGNCRSTGSSYQPDHLPIRLADLPHLVTGYAEP